LVPLTLARLGARARRRGRRLRGRRAHRAPALPLSAPVPLCTPPCFMWMHCARRTHGHASSPCMCDPSLVDRTSCTGTFCAGDCRRQPVCAQRRARARSSGGWSSAGPLRWAALPACAGRRPRAHTRRRWRTRRRRSRTRAARASARPCRWRAAASRAFCCGWWRRTRAPGMGSRSGV
jgi:hypothetical protein